MLMWWRVERFSDADGILPLRSQKSRFRKIATGKDQLVLFIEKHPRTTGGNEQQNQSHDQRFTALNAIRFTPPLLQNVLHFPPPGTVRPELFRLARPVCMTGNPADERSCEGARGGRGDATLRTLSISTSFCHPHPPKPQKVKVWPKSFRSTCSHLHPHLSSVSLNEWGEEGDGMGRWGGGGDHRTPKTAAAYKECERASAKRAGRETIPYMATKTESNFYQ